MGIETLTDDLALKAARDEAERSGDKDRLRAIDLRIAEVIASREVCLACGLVQEACPASCPGRVAGGWER